MTEPDVGDVHPHARSCRAHLRDWQLPPGWRWGAEGLHTEHRHYQEVIDALGRSLSLVSAPDPAHHDVARSRRRGISRIATIRRCRRRITTGRRSPRAVAARDICAAGSPAKRSARACAAWAPTTCPRVLRVMREIGSALSYLHDVGSAARLYVARNGVDDADGPTVDHRLAVGRADDRHPAGARSRLSVHAGSARVDERPVDARRRSPISGSSRRVCFAALTGETPPPDEVPPIQLLRPDCRSASRRDRSRAPARIPRSAIPSIGVDAARDRPRRRQPHDGRCSRGDEPGTTHTTRSAEVRLRWALADDYEVLAALGAGSFGSVWRVRDLSLGPRSRAQAAAPARRARRAHRRTLSARGAARRAARASGDRADLRLGQPRRRRLVHDGARRGRIGGRSRRALGTAHAERRSRRRSISC